MFQFLSANTKHKCKLFLFTATAFLLDSAHIQAQAQENPVFKSTPYPLPRFASLRFDEVNMRSGPSKDYPILWTYNRKGLPVEIILEFDHWRKIRDSDGEEGWVHKSLLSGRRTAIVTAENPIKLYYNYNKRNYPSAIAMPGVQGEIESCERDFCYMTSGDYSGWINRNALWGVYPNENID